MIDRSYLPFQSARQYQDRKMAKWMGFFLSEHTSALSDNLNTMTFLSELPLEKKLMYLSQLYANQLVARLTVKGKKGAESNIGIIPTLTREHVILKTREGHLSIALADIISIELVEEDYDESA